MSAKFLLPLLIIASSLSAQVAREATPVHLKPDDTAPVVVTIRAGAAMPATATATAPGGWRAVLLAGPHDVYVNNRFIDKSLDIKPGSPLHIRADEDSPILTMSAEDDTYEITGLRGRWTQLQLDKAIIGFVRSAGGAMTAPATTPATVTTARLTDVRTTVPGTPGANTPAVQQPAGGPGRAVTRTPDERTSIAALPRLFEGKLTSTRVPLRPRRPYDFGLEDESGTRFAYLDLSKLLLTEQIEKYLERTVVVYGVARPVPDTKDIVISVESLQLR